MDETPAAILRIRSVQYVPQVSKQQIVEKRKQLAVFFFDGRFKDQFKRFH